MTKKKNEKVQARRLKGFQDYLPETMRVRNSIIDIIRKEAEQASFQSIGTPVLEYSEVLLGVGGETDKQVFRFQDNGDRDVAMRFDLTVPFARFVSEHQGKLVFPFKRIQIGDVWRAEKPQKGRYREFCQCDLDIIGVDSCEADMEILLNLQNTLHKINCGNFTMAVGHRGVLTALIKNTLGEFSEGNEDQALISLDKLSKIGAEKVIALLEALPCSKPEGAAKLVEILTDQGSLENRLKVIRELLAADEEALESLKNLEVTVSSIAELCSEQRGSIVIDFSIARGLGYYTGLVFECTLDEIPNFGSICSGGRYNRLVERYQNQEISGIGGSIGLDRLVAALQELNKEISMDQKDTYFVAIASQDARTYAFKLLQKLRSLGLRSDIALKTQKLGQQFKHANKMNYPFVFTVGSEEMQKNTVSLKNMKTGHEQKDLPLLEIESYI